MRSNSRTLPAHRALPESRLRQAMRRNMTGASGLLLVAGVPARAAAQTQMWVVDPSMSQYNHRPVRTNHRHAAPWWPTWSCS